MLQRLFAWLTGGSQSHSTQRSPSTTKRRRAKLTRTPSPGVYTINRDEMSEEASSQIPDLLAEQAGMEMFTGTVKHAYDATFVETVEQCPRCGAPTSQQYANWVYATDSTPRAMAAPAGYFCTKCPTVIIDQSILKQGVSRGFKYVQVIGLTSNDNKGFQSLSTWNGAKPVYILDEQGNPGGLATMDELSDEERRFVKAQAKRPKRRKLKRNR